MRCLIALIVCVAGVSTFQWTFSSSACSLTSASFVKSLSRCLPSASVCLSFAFLFLISRLLLEKRVRSSPNEKFSRVKNLMFAEAATVQWIFVCSVSVFCSKISFIRVRENSRLELGLLRFHVRRASRKERKFRFLHSSGNNNAT